MKNKTVHPLYPRRDMRVVPTPPPSVVRAYSVQFEGRHNMQRLSRSSLCVYVCVYVECVRLVADHVFSRLDRASINSESLPVRRGSATRGRPGKGKEIRAKKLLSRGWFQQHDKHGAYCGGAVCYSCFTFQPLLATRLTHQARWFLSLNIYEPIDSVKILRDAGSEFQAAPNITQSIFVLCFAVVFGMDLPMTVRCVWKAKQLGQLTSFCLPTCLVARLGLDWVEMSSLLFGRAKRELVNYVCVFLPFPSSQSELRNPEGKMIPVTITSREQTGGSCGKSNRSGGWGGWNCLHKWSGFLEVFVSVFKLLQKRQQKNDEKVRRDECQPFPCPADSSRHNTVIVWWTQFSRKQTTCSLGRTEPIFPVLEWRF